MNELIKMLDPDFIYIQKEVNTDSEILSFIANQLLLKGIVKENFEEALLLREKEFPTGLPTAGAGVAIPHTEASFINENQVAVAVLSNTVPFRMMGMPEQEVDVSIVFLLALKEAKGHLAMLKELMELIQKPELLKALRESTSKEEVMKLIQSFAVPEGKQ